MLGGLAALLVLGAVFGVLLAANLVGIRAAGIEARTALGSAVRHLTRGQTDEGQRQLAVAREAIDDALSGVHRGDMRLVRQVPLIGNDLRVITASVESASDVTAAAELVVEHFTSPHDPIYLSGTVDGHAAAEFAAVWDEAAVLMQRAAERMEKAPESGIGAISQAADEVEERAQQGAVISETIHGVLTQVAQAATSGDPMRALVVFTNGAELRATGGVPVFLMRLEISDQIEMGDLVPSSSTHPPEPVGAPADFQAVFGEFLGSRLWSNLTLSLDGPTIGQIGATMYRAVSDVEPDLVLVMDLVSTGYLLDSFPWVEIDGAPFDPRTLATEFLMDSYRDFPSGNEQNEYLLGVFEDVFGQLLDLEPRSERLAGNVRRAIVEGRLVAWSPDPKIQAGFDLAGVGRRLDDEPSHVDVAVQNFGATKMDLFTTFDSNVELKTMGCALVGRLEISITESTPRRLIPLLQYQADNNRWWVNFYLPPGAEVQELLADGEPVTGGEATWGERPVASVFVEAPFGGTAVAGVEWLAPLPESGTVTVSTGATVSEPAETIVAEVPPAPDCA